MSWQSRIANTLYRFALRGRAAQKSIEEMRGSMEKSARRIRGAPRAVDQQRLRHEGLEFLRVAHPASRPGRAVLYLHGGGYILGCLGLYGNAFHRISKRCEAPLYAPRYRLAPEHPYPAAVDDAEKAYRYLLDEGGLAPERIVLMGDSAGGGLAFALQMRLRDAGAPLPACSVTLSPWLDLSGSGQSVIDNEARDVFFDRADLPAMAAPYLGETPADHPGVSPLFGDVSGLPPALFQVSDSELLLDDSRRMARKLEAADVATLLHVYHEQPHVWQMLGGMLPEANEALDELGAFARGHLDRSPADRMASRSPMRANA